MHGQEDYFARQLRVLHIARHLETVFRGHVHVQNGDVRFKLANELQRRFAIISFADDFELRISFNYLAQAAAEDGMIIGDDDADCRKGIAHNFYALSLSTTGSAISSRV